MVEISIVVPFYNSSKTLERCLKSILNQSFRNFEVILINDGSKDASELVVRQYTDSKIKYYSLPSNRGVSFARNVGLKKATGKYVAFVDSDDVVAPEFLFRLHQAISNCDIAMCGLYPDYSIIDKFLTKSEFLSSPSLYTKIQYINFCANKLFKRQLIVDNNIRFRENILLGEDALFLGDYYKYCNRIACVSEKLYFYLDNATSAVNRYNSDFWNMEKMVIEKQWSMFYSEYLNEQEKQFMYSWLMMKFRGVMYYYVEYLNSISAMMEYLNDIYNHWLFKEMCDSKYYANDKFSVKDKMILFIWKYFGAYGVISVRKFKKLLRLHSR